MRPHRTGSRVLIACLLVGLGAARSAPGQPRDAAPELVTFAFLVGVSKYEPPLRSLPHTTTEVAQLRDLLLASGVPEDNVVLLNDPTRREILEGLRNLTARPEKPIGRRHTLILVLDGHGYEGKDGFFFCPADSDASASTGITLPVLFDSISVDWEGARDIAPKQTLLILNTCRDVQGRGSFFPKKFSQPATATILCACSENEQSHTRAVDRGTIFFESLLKAWKGEARNKDDATVDVRGLFRCLEKKFRETPGITQTPELFPGKPIPEKFILRANCPRYFSSLPDDFATECSWRDCIFEGFSLRGKQLAAYDFTGSTFVHVDLSGAQFVSGTTLSFATFENCNLTNVDFTRASPIGVRQIRFRGQNQTEGIRWPSGTEPRGIR